jgi:hypothetical protein
MHKLYIFLVLIFISSCATITGEDTIQSTNVDESKARNILKNYMINKSISWGEPTFMRISPPKYIFEFFTPKKELPKLGVRIIIIDINTGEVSVPMRL